MDFFTEKELKGLKGDLKAREIALSADKEQFKQKLIVKYGKEMESVFNENKQDINEEKHEVIKNEHKKKSCFLKRLFSI